MNSTNILTGKRRAASVGGLLAIVAALGGCLSAEEQRQVNLREDVGTCSDFGAPYGSRAHTDCLLQQQQRRDDEQLLNLERARISSETARNNLEVLEAIRERRERD